MAACYLPGNIIVTVCTQQHHDCHEFHQINTEKKCMLKILVKCINEIEMKRRSISY